MDKNKVKDNDKVLDTKDNLVLNYILRIRIMA